MDNRIKHLEMIQAVIQRMANNSFQLKGWAVTLVGVIGALSTAQDDKRFFLLAFIPILAFWGRDSFYIRGQGHIGCLYWLCQYEYELCELGVWSLWQGFDGCGGILRWKGRRTRLGGTAVWKIGEYLPLMTSIYQPGYVWSTDKAALESYEDTLWTKMQATVNEYASLVGGQRQEVDQLQRELLDWYGVVIVWNEDNR